MDESGVILERDGVGHSYFNFRGRRDPSTGHVDRGKFNDDNGNGCYVDLRRR